MPKRSNVAKNTLGKITLGIAVAGLALAATPARAEFTLIVTHPVPPLVPNSVMDLCQTLGIYKDVGLEVKIVRVQQTPSAVAALRSGNGDMANISTSTALQLVARDQMKLKAVLSPNKSIPFLIAAKKDISSPKMLEGKTFGVGRIGSLDYTLSRLVLGSKGVDTKSLKMVAIGQPSVRERALVAGRVDATTMSIGVWTSIKDKSGVRVVVPTDQYFEAAPLLSKVNVVTAETLAKKPDEIRKFIKAVMMLSRKFSKEPSAWADAMVKAGSKVPRAKLEALGKAYTRSWSVNGGLNLKQVAYTTKRQYFRKDFKGLRKVDPSEWIVTKPIDDVLKQIGVDPNSDATGR